jgi:UDP-N-acetylmuramate--alanine ligase
VTGAPPDAVRAIHMVGIGGAGMSGLARLAIQAGYRVSGTDRTRSAVLEDLQGLGARVSVGHAASAIGPDVDALVVSTAIAADNPERREAERRGIPILHRSELLVELMRGHRGLAVAGAHGKSTTSAMLLAALGDASACVGATIAGGGGTGAVWGTSEWFVAEADESDRSLLRLEPEGVILLNVDHDHHTTYASIEEVEGVFAEFLARVPANGMIVAGPEPDAAPRAWRLASASGRPYRLIGDGLDAWARIGARDVDRVRIEVADGRRVTLGLQVPGAHNAANAACALALAEWCGVPLEVAAERLAGFAGVGRRFEYRGAAAGIVVVDDYAHHPAEIRATLRGARERHPGRIVAIFQPHLYSRTRALADDLADALGGADVAIVTEIYAAREAPDPGISGKRVADAIMPPTHAEFAPTIADATKAALRLVEPGDMVLTLGAGDITELGQELLRRLEYEYPIHPAGGGAGHRD